METEHRRYTPKPWFVTHEFRLVSLRLTIGIGSIRVSDHWAFLRLSRGSSSALSAALSLPLPAGLVTFGLAVPAAGADAAGAAAGFSAGAGSDPPQPESRKSERIASFDASINRCMEQTFLMGRCTNPTCIEQETDGQYQQIKTRRIGRTKSVTSSRSLAVEG